MLAFLLTILFFSIKSDNSLLKGELFGINTSSWLLVAVLSPILHQIYVLLCWRSELLYNSISKTFGANGFKLYKTGFTILFLSRLLTIVFLAISNSNTLPINTVLAFTLAAICFILSAYLFYSVKKYFGIDRAFGIDHFHPKELKTVPFVRKGIFKYTSNGMYIYGFLILYIPGFLLLSKAALLVALFNHIYIWAHYYFTELPDIKIIYDD